MSADLKEYKGFAVSVEDSGLFTAWRMETRDAFGGEKAVFKTEKIAEAPTLEGLHKKVDELSKQKLGMTVWIRQYGGWAKGKVTSIRQEKNRYTSHGFRARVQLEGREWTDADPQTLVMDTDDNAERVAQIRKLEHEKALLEKSIKSFEENMERHKLEDFLGGKA